MKQNKQLQIGDNSFRIAVRGFAKLSTEGNIVATCFSEGSEKAEGQEKEMTSDDEIEEPVSPPACSTDDYPELVLSSERETSNDSFNTAQVEVPVVIPTSQQKLSQLRSQLLLLSATQLQELTTSLKNHIRNAQQSTNTERPKEQSITDWRSMDVHKVLNDQTRLEKEGKGSLPLLPLTIWCLDHPPPPTTTLPTLHMSGGMMVTMAEETGINRQTKRRLKHFKHEKETESKTILPTFSKESQPIISEDLPTVLPALKEDQCMKTKHDRILESSCRKMRKVEVPEELSEVMADEETHHKDLEESSFRNNGISADKMTNTHKTNFKTGKPKSLDPLPDLPEFIEDLLNNPNQNPKTVSWKNVEEGIFRIRSLQSFYKVWRDKKDLPISYELLNKSIKLCEENETLVKISKRRSVYRLGKKSMAV